jgi:hypothetical protein
MLGNTKFAAFCAGEGRYPQQQLWTTQLHILFSAHSM